MANQPYLVIRLVPAQPVDGVLGGRRQLLPAFHYSNCMDGHC
jgi:hypothetical protein